MRTTSLLAARLDVDRADAGALQLFFELRAQLHVFMQQLA